MIFGLAPTTFIIFINAHVKKLVRTLYVPIMKFNREYIIIQPSRFNFNMIDLFILSAHHAEKAYVS